MRQRCLLLALTCCLTLVVSAESAPRRKRATLPQDVKRTAQEQDEYRSCDVSVRDFVQGRKEATALPVKEVRSDGLRMTLNFVHPYGESGDTPPNLAFTRGESIEDRRKALNEAKQRMRVLEEAARTGNVWYVIALDKGDPGLEARRSPASTQAEDQRPSATAAVFANIENRCVSIYEFKTIPLDALSPELRTLLGDESASPSAHRSAGPPS